MAGNYYASSRSMFPYTGGDHHNSQSNQHHGNYMNGTSSYLNYENNSGDHNSQMFSNYNNQNSNYNQNNSFFASSSNNQSNDQFWNKRGAHSNYNNRNHADQQYGDSQSIRKLSSDVNRMSIDSNSRSEKTKSELSAHKSNLIASGNSSKLHNAKQQTQQPAPAAKTMSWASIASQPAKAQPKSFKSKLATVVLSTNTTKHVPPPMPPVAQISLDEIEPITNPWIKNNKTSKEEPINDFDHPAAAQQPPQQQYNNRNDNASDHSSPRDYNAQHNHRQYRDNDQQQRFDPQGPKRYPPPGRFDNSAPPSQSDQSNSRLDSNNRFEARPHNNDRYQNRNNNGLNNSYNSHSSRGDNSRDNNFNNPPSQQNYQPQHNNYNRNDYQPPQNRNYNNNNYGGGNNQAPPQQHGNYNSNYHNKYPNQRPQYNNQFQKPQLNRPGGGYSMQHNKNQMPPQQFPSKPIQLTEQQQIQQEKEAQALLDKLNSENNYNPPRLELNQKNARYFIIKSYSEDDIHRSIKYSIWCSTEHGNMKLDNAFKEQMGIGPVYLLYSVNGSGHFCGVAQMVSPVDYNASSGVWAQDKWKGQFKVKWIYVKDVPNGELRHIVLENNDFKPVTNSRDTQEVPNDKGRAVMDIIHAHKHKTSIFDDFFHYERKQYEELLASRQRNVESPIPSSTSSSNASGRPHQQYQSPPPQPQQPYNSRQRPQQTEPNKMNSSSNRETSSPADNLNNSNNSKTSLMSSNYEPSSGNIKKSWADDY